MSDRALALPFICPLCASALVTQDKCWQCTGHNPQQRQHSFDVAKQGYVNLLPVQQKKSKQPGDTEDSVAARQRFLQAGGYQPFRDALIAFCETMRQQTGQPDIGRWLEVGCGEGYYTEGFLGLQPQQLIALDISKPAVMATAKRLKSIAAQATSAQKPLSQTFSVVASASQVPLPDGSVNVISSLFSPILPDEFARLLAPDGWVLIGKPAAQHLYELREGLFDTVVAHDSDKFIEAMAPYFSLAGEQRVSYPMSLNSVQFADLLTMTPYAYRAKPEKRAALLAQCEKDKGMTINAAFVIYAFAKK